MEPSAYHSLRIIDVREETPDAKTFVLEPLHGWQPVYQAGQFITLVFQSRSGEQRRSFSISSSPLNGEPLSITVKKLDNGAFSRLLIYHYKKGDILLCAGMGGFFVLPKDPDSNRYFFLAAGSGITPCFSLIKTLLEHSPASIILIYSNKNISGTIFYDQLLQLEQRFASRLMIKFLFSDLFDIQRSRLSSWLLNQLLDSYLGDQRQQLHFYVCGPFSYMQMVLISLRTYGIADHQITREDFNPLPRTVIPRPPDVTARQVRIHLEKNIYDIVVQYPQSITKAAKAAGIPVPYSCEAGRCGSCVATCRKGTIWMAYNEVLMDEEIEKGRVLTCQGFPVYGDAEIFF